MRTPKESTAGRVLGGGPQLEASVGSWTPAKLGSALINWMNPTSKNVTLVSGNVQALADANPGSVISWTAPSAGRRPGYTASGTNGQPCMVLSSAANSYLSTASG